VGDVAALLGTADQLLDSVVPEVDRRPVRRGLGTVLIQNLFLLFRRIGLASSFDHLVGPAGIGLKLWSIDERAAYTPPTGYPNCRLITRHGIVPRAFDKS